MHYHIIIYILFSCLWYISHLFLIYLIHMFNEIPAILYLLPMHMTYHSISPLPLPSGIGDPLTHSYIIPPSLSPCYSMDLSGLHSGAFYNHPQPATNNPPPPPSPCPHPYQGSLHTCVHNPSLLVSPCQWEMSGLQSCVGLTRAWPAQAGRAANPVCHLP